MRANRAGATRSQDVGSDAPKQPKTNEEKQAKPIHAGSVARVRSFRSYSIVAARADTKLDSTVRYLGIEVDDALSTSEQVDLWRIACGVVRRRPHVSPHFK